MPRTLARLRYRLHRLRVRLKRGPDLVYAAVNRCPCGAGLAYDTKGPSGARRGYWDCSAILLETAPAVGEPGSTPHTAQLAFTFYEIKSERQPSQRGATTRPTKGVPA